MGFFLTEPMTGTATERRTVALRPRTPRTSRVQAKNRIGAPLGNRVLSTKYTDPETGLVYFGYRFYWPGMGRWLSRDPIGERGGLNVYLGVQNNAISRIDPRGLEVWYLVTDAAVAQKIGQMNALVRTYKDMVKTAIDSGYKITEFIWYAFDPKAGKFKKSEKLSKEEFLKRLDTEHINHVDPGKKNSGDDLKKVIEAAAKHSHEWDYTAYAVHADQVKIIRYADGPEERDDVEKKFVGSVKPSQGTFLFAACVGDENGGFAALQSLAVVITQPLVRHSEKSKNWCQVGWYTIYVEKE